MFGDHSYSREELVAEFTAAFLCGRAGIDNSTIEASASYLALWAAKIRDEPAVLTWAAGQAQRAFDRIVSTPVAQEQAA